MPTCTIFAIKIPPQDSHFTMCWQRRPKIAVGGAVTIQTTQTTSLCRAEKYDRSRSTRRGWIQPAPPSFAFAVCCCSGYTSKIYAAPIGMRTRMLRTLHASAGEYYYHACAALRPAKMAAGGSRHSLKLMYLVNDLVAEHAEHIAVLYARSCNLSPDASASECVPVTE